MGIEIERKFLIKHDGWKSQVLRSEACQQGYMVSDPKRTVRVRMMGSTGYLTVKGATAGLSRMEFEYAIPRADAEGMMQLCDRVVEKTRHYIEYKGMTWELDEFKGTNFGLIMAEIELESEDQQIEIPDWVGEEVSGDPRYYNASLSRTPFSTWPN